MVIVASLTFKGVQFYDTADPPSRRFWVTENGPGDEEWEVRGADDVISAAAGRTSRNRVKDVLPITVEGYINGVGATIAAQRTSYHTTLTTLNAVLQTDGTIGALVWAAPDGNSYSINVRFITRGRGDWQNGLFRRFTLEFECIDPAGWVEV